MKAVSRLSAIFTGRNKGHKYVKENLSGSPFLLSVAAASAAVVVSAAAAAVAGARDDEDKDDYPPAAVVTTHKHSLL